MCTAGTLPRPVPINIPEGVGSGARTGGVAGGIGAIGMEAVKAATRDATRASEEARTGRCSSGDKWDGSGDCNSCHPKKGSKSIPPNRHMNTDKGNGTWWQYQLRIANLHAAPNVFKIAAPTLEEWLYKGVYFDGFWEKACTLVDAKNDYHFLLFELGKAKAKEIKDNWLVEATRQLTAAMPMPPARLSWYFSQPDTCQEASNYFMYIPMPIPCIYLP